MVLNFPGLKIEFQPKTRYSGRLPSKGDASGSALNVADTSTEQGTWNYRPRIHRQRRREPGVMFDRALSE